MASNERLARSSGSAICMRSCLLNFRLIRSLFFAYGLVVDGFDGDGVWLRREGNSSSWLYALYASNLRSRLFLGRTTFIFSLQHCHSVEPLLSRFFPFHPCPYFLFTGTTTTRLTALALKAYISYVSRGGKVSRIRRTGNVGLMG